VHAIQVIDCNIIPPLLLLLQTAEFDIKKEAAWAISNATSGGTPAQIKYLVTQGCIKPLCDLLQFQDPRIVTVALEGLENILKMGQLDRSSDGRNEYATSRLHCTRVCLAGRIGLVQSAPLAVDHFVFRYADFVVEADGLSKIESLQNHEHQKIYESAVKILDQYFETEDGGEDADIAPAMDDGQAQYMFGPSSQAIQPGGFSFDAPMQ
jgi:hypothetical protein